MCFAMEAPTQKFGYLDVKQSAKVKGRKLKSWKRRWVVLTKMTDMSSDQIVAKIDLYENETVWLTNRSEKTTYVLDHVTSIQRTRSRTHPHAFEVIQRQPELVFSGNSEIDSFGWILTLQQIFTPHLVEVKKGSYHVTIQANADASRWKLSGEYRLVVSPECVSLFDLQTGNNLISWGLSTLMRFNVVKDVQNGDVPVLVIECGKNGPTGESKFGFISNEASDILKAIRQSICLALARRQNARNVNVVSPRDRSISESHSEKQFQSILESSQLYLDVASRDRSGSESSGRSLTPISPYPATIGIDNPLISSPDICHGLPSRLSNSELTSLNESDEQECDENDLKQSGRVVMPSPRIQVKQDKLRQHFRHASLPVTVRQKAEDPGYSVIKDVVERVSTEVETRSRRNTIATDDVAKDNSKPDDEPPIHPPPRRKRTSTINIARPKRGAPFDKGSETRSGGVDSAIATSLLSSSLDSAKLRAENLIHIERSLSPSKEEVGDSDIIGSPNPTSPGHLDRRRSSSTPDLAAFWKHQASLENVYEELDSIRSSVATRKLPASPKDTPPALPARPFNLIVPTYRNNSKNNQTVVRLKKSFFFTKSKMHRGKSMLSIGGSRACYCNYPYISSKGFLLSGGNDNVCGQCGGSISAKNYEETHNKSVSKSNIFDSAHSSLNDIYASIADVKDKSTKRRRSSDILKPNVTKNNNNNEISNQILEKDPAKFYSLRRRDPQKQRNLQEVMTYGSDETIRNLRQQGASRLSTGSKDDPLVGFFLDDENFQSNPMVTGRLAGSRHNLQLPSVDLMSPDSPKNFTKKDCFTEDIFMMEPDSVEDSNNVLKPSNIGIVSPSFMRVNNNTKATQNPFNPFCDESDLLFSPVTYTSLQNPAIYSANTSFTSPWSGLDPFQVDISLNSCHLFTPSPLTSPANIQFTPQTDAMKTSTPESDSLYLSMEEIKKDNRSSDPMSLVSISNKVSTSEKLFENNHQSFQSSNDNNISMDLFTSPTFGKGNDWLFSFGDENQVPGINRVPSLVTDNEDVYVCPGVNNE